MDEDVLNWVGRVNKRGLSGLFTDKMPGDKVTAEMLQLLYWTDEMESSFGVTTESFERCLNDPPDFSFGLTTRV